ncbi:MAG: NIPSNAP family protein [Gammaproteobacteria bacterium]
MIYELRTYTLKPGSQPVVAKNAGEVARAIRGDDYGKLEGYWLTDIGPLNQVLHLWSYENLEERRRLRAELARNKDWTDTYLPLIRPHLVRQDIRLMEACVTLKAPAAAGNVYEYRNYRALPGRAREWARLFADVLPVREKYSKNVCAWITEAGQPNEVSHLWAYPSLAARTEARGGATKNTGLRAFLEKATPLLEEMHSTVILPAQHSPLQ